MRKAIVLLAAAMAAVLGASAAMANAGSQLLARDNVVGSTRSCDIAAGRTCFYAFNATVNSAVFNVSTANAVACIDGDIASSVDSTSSVSFWIVVNDGLKAGGFIPTAASTSTLSDASNDCFTMPTGLWWIEVNSVDSAKHGLVKITGRDSE